MKLKRESLNQKELNTIYKANRNDSTVIKLLNHIWDVQSYQASLEKRLITKNGSNVFVCSDCDGKVC